MSLKLNQSPENFKEFYDTNVKQMSKIIAEGRVPMSVAGLMQRRINIRNASNDVKSAWMNNYFDTGDAIVYHPDGRVKIVLDSQYLRDMTPETPRNSGALVLIPEQYDTMKGEEFKKGKLRKIGERLSKKDVKTHPVWKILARDQDLLNDYADLIFAEGKERFGYDTAMGVYLTLTNGDSLEMRVWYVDGLVGWSDVVGWGDLNDISGRFVGVMPKRKRVKV